MNNNGNFNNNQPAALMSYPFPMHNPPQHPTYIEQPYMSQPQQHYQTHIPHYYNPRPTIQTPPKSEKRKQEILTCDACGIEVNSQQMMDAHVRGQKHIKKMKLKTVSTTNTSINQPSESINTDEQFLSPTLSSTSISIEPVVKSEQNSSATPTTPIGTASPIVVKPTSSNEKSALQLMNELAKHNKVEVKYDLVKETGPAHCKQFEVQLTAGSEIYHGTGTSIKRAQQDAAEKALASTTLRKPDPTQRGSHAARTLRGEVANQGIAG